MMTHKSNRRGAGAIEFALTFPVLATILVATMDYGWYFSQQMAVTAAVRDATRVGSTLKDDDPNAAEEAAEEVIVESLRRHGLQGEIVLDVRRTGLAPEESLHVGVSMDYRPLVGMLPTPSQIGASLSMRLEHQQI